MNNRFSVRQARLLVLMLLASTSVSAMAQSQENGGVALSATRVIFDCNSGKETSLTVRNSDPKRSFLVQSWASDTAGVKNKSFAVTPPLFVLRPNSENKLRILYAGPPLAQDRETLFWLTNKSIPAINKTELEGKNVLQLAISARIKGFCRPSGLTTSVADAPAQLSFHWQGQTLELINPTPYYITVVEMKANGKDLPSTMVPPKDSVRIVAPAGASGKVSYQTINDFGALTPAIQAQPR